MLILIIESSTEKGCIILAENEKVLASTTLSGGPELSKTIALEVKNLLSKQTPDLIAVGIGPGSYTGIRVGASLAKALAYGWQIPCLGFCSLKTFGPPPVLVDARSGGIFALLGEKASLMAPESLTHLTSFRSPNPELIEKRLKNGAALISSEPDPSYLAKVVWDQFSEEGAPSFSLDYGSS